MDFFLLFGRKDLKVVYPMGKNSCIRLMQCTVRVYCSMSWTFLIYFSIEQTKKKIFVEKLEKKKRLTDLLDFCIPMTKRKI